MTARAKYAGKKANKLPPSASPERTIRSIYRKLSRLWGPQHWWPAETPFEVIAGAILTQNTSWTNVEYALVNLREADELSIEGIRELPLAQLELLVRPSGYFRQKARRLKDFIAFLDERYGGSLDSMFATPTLQLRTELLAQKGIGPETADSILLYAGHQPIFVVDAYARRVLERHDAVADTAKYDEIRDTVEGALRGERQSPEARLRKLSPQRPASHTPSTMSTASRVPMVQVYNEMHSLFVQLGKHYCHKREPSCNTCPLGKMLSHPVLSVDAKKRSASIRQRASKVRGKRSYNQTRP